MVGENQGVNGIFFIKYFCSFNNMRTIKSCYFSIKFLLTKILMYKH